MAIEMQAVVSSLIAAIGFDRETDELIIQFPKGGMYAYKGVLDNGSKRTYEHYGNLCTLMLRGESVGKYFLAHVKKDVGLTYRKVEPDDAADKADHQ